jgi:hypothetical protein
MFSLFAKIIGDDLLMNSSDPNRKSLIRGFHPFLLVNLIGIDLVVCIFGGYYLGKFLSSYTGSDLWIPLAVLLGTGLGIWSIIVILIRYSGGGDE